jgi:hypothetical protein
VTPWAEAICKRLLIRMRRWSAKSASLASHQALALAERQVRVHLGAEQTLLKVRRPMQRLMRPRRALSGFVEPLLQAISPLNNTAGDLNHAATITKKIS